MWKEAFAEIGHLRCVVAGYKRSIKQTFWPIKLISGGMALQGNSWSCSCENVWLGRWLRRWMREALQLHTSVVERGQTIRNEPNILMTCFLSFLVVSFHDEPVMNLILSAKYWGATSGLWWGPSPATTRTAVSAPWWSWTATRPVTTRWGSARPRHWSPAGGQPGWSAWSHIWWSHWPCERRSESLCLNKSVTLLLSLISNLRDYV